ncbi:hypothetical protein QBC32DRAFT_382577 [Pseudoneurospora amorphoporcata]|uniref:Uncharacterized protein n=1 Tax=Pseudoneurospora amorphoporcata TaxID=241081 RepID=A0AAN6SCB1_9PEZI|nr:hypothetical protein QBC32DRAFT_382577 [Pseudoneurospora amorphoporcata]
MPPVLPTPLMPPPRFLALPTLIPSFSATSSLLALLASVTNRYKHRSISLGFKNNGSSSRKVLVDCISWLLAEEPVSKEAWEAVFIYWPSWTRYFGPDVLGSSILTHYRPWLLCRKGVARLILTSYYIVLFLLHEIYKVSSFVYSAQILVVCPES